MFDWLLGPLLSMVGFDYRNKRQKDRALLEEFLTILPSDSDAVLFLKDHDMGYPAPLSYFRPLHQVSDYWRGPDKEFQVGRLERLKVSFIESLQEFLSHYAKRSGGEGGGFVSIGLRDWEDRPEMLEYKKELNELSTAAYRKYEEFVRLARKEI